MASLTPAQALALLEDTSLSDYTIKCDDHVFPVHKAILCHKSEFFAACIKNVHFEESLKSTLVIRESSPVAVAVLLVLIYTDFVSVMYAYKVWPQLSKVSNSPKDMSDDNRSLLRNGQIYLGAYQLATRCMLDDLKPRLRDSVMLCLKVNQFTYKYKDERTYIRGLVDAVVSHTEDGDVVLRPVFIREILERTFPKRWCKDDENGWRDVLSSLIEHEPVAFEMGLSMEKNK